MENAALSKKYFEAYNGLYNALFALKYECHQGHASDYLDQCSEPTCRDLRARINVIRKLASDAYDEAYRNIDEP